MRILTSITAALALIGTASAVRAAPVLMISIDGLRPADVLEAPSRGLKIPTLRALAAEGAFASDVVNVLPTVTYPNHTTLITGVRPAVHGIANNATFDPLQTNQGGWYWYAADIKVPTLWDAVHAKGGVVASLGWPVSVGARSIDDNIPEYWRARNAEDLKLVEALSTPGLVAALTAETGVPLSAVANETPESDEAKSRWAAAIYRLKRPAFFTVHLSSLDHVQHIYGPDTAPAKADLERIDADVARIVAAGRAVEPDLVVAIVSDHGFAPVHHDVNLLKPFADAGLMSFSPTTGKPLSWQAAPWGGASVAVVLAHPEDPALVARVKALLDKLAADPSLHIEKVIDRPDIARRGAATEASFWIDFDLDYEMGQSVGAPSVSPSLPHGMHGWFPDHPEMHSTFFVNGPGLPHGRALGQVDMRDIAPTLAEAMGVQLPTAQGKPLF